MKMTDSYSHSLFATYPNDTYHNHLINALRKQPRAVESSCGFFPSHNKARLFYRFWTLPDAQIDKMNTIIIHIHGMTAHSEPVIVIADQLLDQSTLLFSFDLSGHGRSEGERGNITRFMRFVEDLEDAVAFIHNRHPSCRLILSAESMGALVAMLFIYIKQPTSSWQFEKILLWSPAFRPNLQEGWVKDWKYMLNLGTGLLFAKTFPSINVDHSKTFSDPDALAYHNRDPYILGKISAQYLMKISIAMDHLWHHANKRAIDFPICIFHAERDFLVLQPASVEFFRKFLSTTSASSKYILVNHSWHALFYDRYFTSEHWDIARAFIRKTNISA
jgi:alpha-beta hydrolase superfamily lysophospholipase